MNQQTLSDIGHGGRIRNIRREKFLDTVNPVIPWEERIVIDSAAPASWEAPPMAGRSCHSLME